MRQLEELGELGGNCRMGSKNVNKLRSAVGGVNVEIGAGERVS